MGRFTLTFWLAVCLKYSILGGKSGRVAFRKESAAIVIVIVVVLSISCAGVCITVAGVCSTKQGTIDTTPTFARSRRTAVHSVVYARHFVVTTVVIVIVGGLHTVKGVR